ncbi:hypothetical protein [Hymenobacter weizhouensis]|uniref:hypothetical protein n=1 Tax=Hymenobacter sp. YIM 151500-1 TaxID=2987689 RepID=UPI002227CED4|nr:hypothetical protein [Hymenobacter sp. YIM 151500-1]UYZ61468.1 hypothetical protein OIS53_10655 [Hymenobacter sp. YIM 151500-1]
MRLSTVAAWLLVSAGAGLAACTTTQETATEEGRVQSPPSTIRSDADRQAAYNSNAGYGGSVPDATPGRVPVGEQAAAINSRKRPESLNTNAPNTSTPETRLRRLNGAPTDTLRLPRQ